MTFLAAFMAVAGSVVVAFGVGLVFLPAGVVVLGLEIVAAAYVVGYVGVRRDEASRRPRS